MAGFFISLIGELPDENDTVTYENFTNTVIKVEKRTIKRLRVEILNSSEIDENN